MLYSFWTKVCNFPNCFFFKCKNSWKNSLESCFSPPSPLQPGAAGCMQKSSLTKCRPSDEACQLPNLTVKEGGHFLWQKFYHISSPQVVWISHHVMWKSSGPTVRLRHGEPPHMLVREAIEMVKCNILSLPGGSRRKWHGMRWETISAVQPSACLNQVWTKTWPKVNPSSYLNWSFQTWSLSQLNGYWQKLVIGWAGV